MKDRTEDRIKYQVGDYFRKNHDIDLYIRTDLTPWRLSMFQNGVQEPFVMDIIPFSEVEEIIEVVKKTFPELLL